MPCQVVSRFSRQRNRKRLRQGCDTPTYCQGNAGSPDGNWVHGDQPPPLLAAAILRAENGGEA